MPLNGCCVLCCCLHCFFFFVCVVVLSLSSLGHQVVATHKGIASSTKTQTREKKKVVMGEQKGWLLKEGPSMAWIWGRQWLRRYCTITDKDPTAIVYYTEPDAPAPKGRIDVSCVCAMKPSKAHAQTIHKNIHAHSDTHHRLFHPTFFSSHVFLLV